VDVEAVGVERAERGEDVGEESLEDAFDERLEVPVRLLEMEPTLATVFPVSGRLTHLGVSKCLMEGLATLFGSFGNPNWEVSFTMAVLSVCCSAGCWDLLELSTFTALPLRGSSGSSGSTFLMMLFSMRSALEDRSQPRASNSFHTASDATHA